jgi:hypothetical protein
MRNLVISTFVRSKKILHDFGYLLTGSSTIVLEPVSKYPNFSHIYNIGIMVVQPCRNCRDRQAKERLHDVEIALWLGNSILHVPIRQSEDTEEFLRLICAPTDLLRGSGWWLRALRAIVAM